MVITKFTIFEARKKIIFDKEYIDWIIRHNPNFNKYSPESKLVKLLRKYLRWKLDVDRVYTPIRNT